jgi:hypothetical protein
MQTDLTFLSVSRLLKCTLCPALNSSMSQLLGYHVYKLAVIPQRQTMMQLVILCVYYHIDEFYLSAPINHLSSYCLTQRCTVSYSVDIDTCGTIMSLFSIATWFCFPYEHVLKRRLWDSVFCQRLFPLLDQTITIYILWYGCFNHKQVQDWKQVHM